MTRVFVRDRQPGGKAEDQEGSMKAKSKAQWLAAVLLVLVVDVFQAEAQDFKDTREALTALKSKDFNESWKHMEYLAAHPQESTPALMRLVAKRDDGWIPANASADLNQTGKVVLF